MTETNTHFFNQKEPHKYISLDGLDIDGNPATAKTVIAADEAKERVGLGKLVEFPGTYRGPEAEEDDGGQDTPEAMISRIYEETVGEINRLSPDKRALVWGGVAVASIALGFLVAGGEADLPHQMVQRASDFLSVVR